MSQAMEPGRHVSQERRRIVGVGYQEVVGAEVRDGERRHNLVEEHRPCPPCPAAQSVAAQRLAAGWPWRLTVAAREPAAYDRNLALPKPLAK